MLLLILGWCGNALQLIMLHRALRTKNIGRYPYFYGYIASTLATVALSIVFLVNSGATTVAYARWYWPIQLATLMLGCGIVLEIFRHILSAYPSVERFATVTGLITFGGVFCLAIVSSLWLPASPAGSVMVELERNLRTVQAFFLIGILTLIAYYRIPIGRNMKGMIVGYGVYVGTSLLALSVRAYAGAWLLDLWRYVQPVSFLLSLSIWLVALWSYYPNPVPESVVRVEEDYELLASRTRRALNIARSQLTRTARP